MFECPNSKKITWKKGSKQELEAVILGFFLHHLKEDPGKIIWPLFINYHTAEYPKCDLNGSIRTIDKIKKIRKYIPSILKDFEIDDEFKGYNIFLEIQKPSPHQIIDSYYSYKKYIEKNNQSNEN